MAANLSIIITAKNRNDPKLKDLEYSLSKQSYQDFETLIITEGNSESAKAIGLKRAKGKIICILASDNYLNDPDFLKVCLEPFEDETVTGTYPVRYFYDKDDDILNRYFALFGVNDPIPLYLGKNDRLSYYEDKTYHKITPLIFQDKKYCPVILDFVPTLGDNGFFIRRKTLLQADIENYYHIDVCQDLFNKGFKKYVLVNTSIWHKTGGNIIKFFKKRFKYADKFSKNRRWHMVEKKDMPKLAWFVFSTLTFIYPFYLSIKGYKKIKDIAWFLHLPVCLLTIGVYGALCLKKLIRK